MIITAVLTAALTLSCAEDREVSDSSGERQQIQLTVDDHQDWMQTESAGQLTRGAFAPRKLRMNGNVEGLSLCLTTTTVNGIHSGKATAEAVTRGMPLTTMNGDFGLSGYLFDSAQPWNAATATELFYNETATKSGSTWTLPSVYYWPAITQALRMFGYYPASATGISVPATLPAGTQPYVDFEVQKTVSEQVDFMVAASDSVTWNEGPRVRLPFKHALTCVNFYVGAGLPSGWIIKSIQLKNIYSKGRYTIGQGWSGLNTREKYEIENLNMSTTNAIRTKIVHPNGSSYSTLLMIPQDFTAADNASVEMVLNNGRQDFPVTAMLDEEVKWLPGTTVSFFLSADITSTTDFVITAEPVTLGHEGGEGTYRIASYQQDGMTGNKTALPWQITGYSTDGTTFHKAIPAEANWVDLTVTSGAGGTAGETGIATVAPQTAGGTQNVTADTYATVQRQRMLDNAANEPGGMRGKVSDYYDLSTHDVSGSVTAQNTANCYIVNAPGYYRLPLVYGNAIKNGAKNESAYKTTVTASNVLKTLVDHNDRSITSPYICETDNQAYSPDKAVVVWQSTEGLITSPQVEDGYLYFVIDKNTIRPGNAVVAACIGSTIVWSWHIWVTALDVMATKTITNAQGCYYDVMPYNLGWTCGGGTLDKYDGRRLWVKVQQSSGAEAVFCISQLAGETMTAYSAPGTSLLYQWGRKDPVLPLIDATTTMPYNSPNGYVMGHYKARTSLGGAVKNPNYRYSDQVNTDWCSTSYLNLWCMDNSQTGFINKDIVKTIYDPCPVGFHVPTSAAFTGYTSTGENVEGTISDPMLKEHLPYIGIWVYTNSRRTDCLFIPDPTYCDWQGNPAYHQEDYRQMTAIPSGLTTICDFTFYNQTGGNVAIRPKSTRNKATSNAVRAVREK